jgi:hypothetical protein
MSRGVSNAKLLVCALLSAGLMGAACPFQVYWPAGRQAYSQDFSIDQEGRIRINVVFTDAVDMSSVIAGTNVILETENDANADTTVYPGDVQFYFMIVSTDDYHDLLTFDPDGFFTLHLLGSGTSPIISADGEALDGDKDFEPGGDYETTFLLLG